jgi:hypothetical protein
MAELPCALVLRAGHDQGVRDDRVGGEAWHEHELRTALHRFRMSERRSSGRTENPEDKPTPWGIVQ